MNARRIHIRSQGFCAWNSAPCKSCQSDFIALLCHRDGRRMSFRKCVTRYVPEKKFLTDMRYKSILWRLAHIQTWLVVPVAPVQLTLQMLNALQSAIVQRISSVTWFTAAVYCKISDDCVDC